MLPPRCAKKAGMSIVLMICLLSVSLSEKGEKAYFHHRMFHEKMVMEVLDGMDKEETEVLTRALTKLQKFFRTYGNDK